MTENSRNEKNLESPGLFLERKKQKIIMVEHMFVTYGESWLMIDFLFLFILLQALQLSGFFKEMRT